MRSMKVLPQESLFTRLARYCNMSIKPNEMSIQPYGYLKPTASPDITQPLVCV